MSLSVFMRQPQIKEAFELYGNSIPDFLPEEKIKVPPMSETKKSGVIGIAFDYLARFKTYAEILWNKPKVEVYETHWKASNAISCVFYIDMEQAKLFNNIIQVADKNFDSFIQNPSELNINKLVSSVQSLAYLDGIPYHPRETIPMPDKLVNRELRQLFDIFEPLKLFKPEKICILQPSLSAGDLVHGAHADLVIDSSIIEFKTNRAYKVNKQDFLQLVGYLVLAKMGGIDGIKNLDIKQAGIYFARYGVFWNVYIDQIFSQNNLKSFIKVFEQTASGFEYPGI